MNFASYLISQIWWNEYHVLTNTLTCFQKAHVNETGLNDNHKLITNFFKTNFSRLRPKASSYRKYNNFDESKFLSDLNKTIITFDNENPSRNYNVLSDRFLEVVNVRTTLKKQIVGVNNAPFFCIFEKKMYEELP